LEFDAPATQNDQIFCVPASVVPPGLPPPEEPSTAPETAEADGVSPPPEEGSIVPMTAEKDGEHFYIGDALQSHVASAAIALLLEHPDEAVRAATRQAVSEACTAQSAPETDTEEDTATVCAEVCSEESIELQVSEELANQSMPSMLTETEEEEDKVHVLVEGVPEQSPRHICTSAKVIQAVMTFGSADQAVFDLAEARGDVTQEFAGLLVQYPHVNQAFRLGRLAMFHGDSDTTAIVKVVITNDGALPWPEASSLRAVSGPAYGFPDLALGAVPSGDTVELVMDLTFGGGQAGEATLSGWAMIDEHGHPFGPLMLLEVARV